MFSSHGGHLTNAMMSQLILYFFLFYPGEKELYTANLTPDLKLDFSQPLAGLLVSSVSCGLEHVVLLSEDGQVYSYGSGR